MTKKKLIFIIVDGGPDDVKTLSTAVSKSSSFEDYEYVIISKHIAVLDADDMLKATHSLMEGRVTKNAGLR